MAHVFIAKCPAFSGFERLQDGLISANNRFPDGFWGVGKALCFIDVGPTVFLVRRRSNVFALF